MFFLHFNVSIVFSLICLYFNENLATQFGQVNKRQVLGFDQLFPVAHFSGNNAIATSGAIATIPFQQTITRIPHEYYNAPYNYVMFQNQVQANRGAITQSHFPQVRLNANRSLQKQSVGIPQQNRNPFLPWQQNGQNQAHRINQQPQRIPSKPGLQRKPNGQPTHQQTNQPLPQKPFQHTTAPFMQTVHQQNLGAQYNKNQRPSNTQIFAPVPIRIPQQTTASVTRPSNPQNSKLNQKPLGRVRPSIPSGPQSNSPILQITEVQIYSPVPQEISSPTYIPQTVVPFPQPLNPETFAPDPKPTVFQLFGPVEQSRDPQIYRPQVFTPIQMLQDPSIYGSLPQSSRPDTFGPVPVQSTQQAREPQIYAPIPQPMGQQTYAPDAQPLGPQTLDSVPQSQTPQIYAPVPQSPGLIQSIHGQTLMTTLQPNMQQTFDQQIEITKGTTPETLPTRTEVIYPDSPLYIEKNTNNEDQDISQLIDIRR